MKYLSPFAFLLVIFCGTLTAQPNATVSFEKYISLKQAGSVIISPDGKDVAWSLTSTDWEANAYDNEIWLSRNGSTPLQLTRTAKGSSFAAHFSPDGKWISFIADRGDKNQLYLVSVNGGEAFPVTKEEDGIDDYDWNPNGTQIAISKTDPETDKVKDSKKKYGGYKVEGEEFELTHLWLMQFNVDSILDAGHLPCNAANDTGANKQPCNLFPKLTRLTEGAYTVTGFRFSPNGKMIVFNHQPNPLDIVGESTDVSLLDISTKKITAIVTNRSRDNAEAWSPDSRYILYSSSLNDTVSNFFRNGHLLVYDLESQKSKEILAGFDEEINIADWNKEGIYFTASQKMKINLYRYNFQNGSLSQVNTQSDLVNSISFTPDGNSLAWSGRKFDGINEVFRQTASQQAIQITSQTLQIKNWNTPVNEIISWKSKDSSIIEGVLIKPKNFDPKKKYPLFCVIHGGPTGTDRPDPVATYVYPIMQWVEKGAIVLRVNYRGSAGYGEKFRSLNVRNLGVGDMWDVISGVEYLQKQGFVDTAKMGCMGWSQGGYISAFLTTNTHIFKAISVGAGISNWITYYVNTDITPFTRQYLKADPWQDKEIYAVTSPMTNINQATTPTLIQHGEFDKRVPIPNAYELYRGLKDRGVTAKLIVYKGFGHGISKPKERLAAIWHNWNWFNHYVFGEKMVEIP